MSRTSQPSIPVVWLMTDARLGDDAALVQAIMHLPRGAGILFRHYHLPPGERAALARRLWALARRRGLVLLLANPGHGWHSHGFHRPSGARLAGWSGRGLVSASAHNRRELLSAFRAGADLVFLSPLFPTRSHPDGRALGPSRFGLLLRGAPGPVLALGGMTQRRLATARALGAAGYAAISLWSC